MTTKYVTHIYRTDGAITHLTVSMDIKTREECIYEIETYKDVIYKTAPVTGIGAEIHVVEPEKGKKFLRTDRNETAADNLGELPEFELPSWYINP